MDFTSMLSDIATHGFMFDGIGMSSAWSSAPNDQHHVAEHYAHASDEACMLGYQQGDAQAFRVIYVRYREKLHRYVLRLAGHAGEAEEVFQDVWLAVIRSAPSYPASMSFAPWLFSIAHRRAADRWRSLRRHVPDWQHRDEADVADALAPLADIQLTPDRSAQNDALGEALMQAVQQLPLPQREAFLMRAEGDLSLDEIAFATGTSRETVKSRLRYAQRRLREGLSSWR